jgi:hypothetical protein
VYPTHISGKRSGGQRWHRQRCPAKLRGRELRLGKLLSKLYFNFIHDVEYNFRCCDQYDIQCYIQYLFNLDLQRYPVFDCGSTLSGK